MTNTIDFQSLGISVEVLDALKDMGFEKPSEIQAEAIPFLMEGRDVTAQSKTGTGKTAAFAIPMIENIQTDGPQAKGLILCPTRELALQVAKEIEKIAKYKTRLRIAAVYGGESMDKQIRQFKSGVDIVVGTPGRIIDHIQRKTFKLDSIEYVVLDEADEMLNMGFREDIEKILSQVPEERQTVLFSATMPKVIMDMTHRFQQNPQLVKIHSKALTVDSIDQFYMEVNRHAKLDLTCLLIYQYQLKLSLIFTNTKKMADQLAAGMQSYGLKAEPIHGDLTQSARNAVMEKFRRGEINFLIATDVAARGIDVEGVEAVINYDFPQDPEYYVHRIGRTGRAGKSGLAFTLIHRSEKRKLQDLERIVKTKIHPHATPEEKEVIQSFKEQSINEFRRMSLQYDEWDNVEFEGLVDEMEAEGLDTKKLLAAILAKKFTPLKKQVAKLKQADARGDDGKRERKRESRPSNESRKGAREGGARGGSGARRERAANMARLFLNLGKKDKIGPGDIVGAISGETGIKGRDIGGIDIYDKFSFVEVPTNEASKVIEVMNRNQIKGYKVNFEIAR